LGRKLSEKHKKKLLESNIGKRQTEETKRKISKTKKGIKFTKKQKENVNNKGDKNPMFGKQHSKESKEKMSKKKKGCIPWNKGKRLNKIIKQNK